MDFNTAVMMPEGTDIHDFAGQLSGEIMDKCEKPLLFKITEHEFPYTPQRDRTEIFNLALRHAESQDGDTMDLIRYKRRKALIEEQALDYLKNNSYIIINGFVNFRLEQYKEELRNLCHDAAEELRALREYDEFLDMLRFFISVQTPKENTVYITKSGGVLRILNKRHRDITRFYSDEASFIQEDFTPEDIVLGALITIAPRKIIICDKRENEKIYDTISSVFGNVEFTK